MVRKRLLVFVLPALTFSADAFADIGLTAARESFRWREYDAAGARLLEETGPRYHFGAEWRHALRSDERLSLRLRGSLYFGDIDYDGQACTISSGSCTPFQTDADYNGVTAEGILAWRIGPIGQVFAGGGFDSWRRDIKGRGNVSGAIENWTTFYAAAGGGASWRYPSIHLDARAGLKLPIITDEETDFGVSLNPKGRFSIFAELSTDVMQGDRAVWGVGLYYDSYRFDESDRERAGSLVIWQPESRQEVVGVRAVVYLR
jgi:hypothetical protein